MASHSEPQLTTQPSTYVEVWGDKRPGQLALLRALDNEDTGGRELDNGRALG